MSDKSPRARQRGASSQCKQARSAMSPAPCLERTSRDNREVEGKLVRFPTRRHDCSWVASRHLHGLSTHLTPQGRRIMRWVTFGEGLILDPSTSFGVDVDLGTSGAVRSLTITQAPRDGHFAIAPTGFCTLCSYQWALTAAGQPWCSGYTYIPQSPFSGKVAPTIPGRPTSAMQPSQT